MRLCGKVHNEKYNIHSSFLPAPTLSLTHTWKTHCCRCCCSWLRKTHTTRMMMRFCKVWLILFGSRICTECMYMYMSAFLFFHIAFFQNTQITLETDTYLIDTIPCLSIMNVFFDWLLTLNNFKMKRTNFIGKAKFAQFKRKTKLF